MIDQATLDERWDFADPAGSEARFRASDDPELRTQLARALGLQGRFEEAHAVLDATAVPIRTALERGRLLNSAGNPAQAIEQFTRAAAEARAAAEPFLEIDALHMLAIADPAHAGPHTEAALALVAHSDDVRTRRWATSLHNNAGWRLHDDGQPLEALAQFELALSSAATDQQKFWARWAVARCLRTLGRNDEARAIQLQLQLEDPGDADVLDELEALAAE